MFDELRDTSYAVDGVPGQMQFAPGKMGGNVTLRPRGTAFGRGGTGLDDPRIDVHGASGGVFDSLRKVVFKEAK